MKQSVVIIIVLLTRLSSSSSLLRRTGHQRQTDWRGRVGGLYSNTVSHSTAISAPPAYSSSNTHQMKMLPSSPPETICLSSGVNLRLLMEFEWPVTSEMTVKDLRSQSRTTPAVPPVAA